MSGNTKRILYRATEAILAVLAVIGTVAVGFFGIIRGSDQLVGCGISLIVFALFCVCLPVSILIHELGHLLFGKLAGMKFVSMSVSCFRLAKGRLRIQRGLCFAGETQMLPPSTKHVRGRTIFLTLGGAMLNLVFGVIFLALFFVVPMHPALYFFELCAPLNLFEGICALLPAELDTGRTDGKILSDLTKKTAYAQTHLAVTSAQGFLMKHSFAELPREMLFNLPVIREDEPAFLALTQLRWYYLYYNGNKTAATNQLERLETLSDYLGDDQRAEVSCELSYAEWVLSSNRAHAEELLLDAESARETIMYRLAQYALTDVVEENLRTDIDHERMTGMRELYTMFLKDAEIKKISAKGQKSDDTIDEVC